MNRGQSADARTDFVHRDIRDATRTCTEPDAAGKLERVARGLYGLPDAEISEHRSLAKVSARVPKVDRLKIDGIDVPVFNAARTVIDCFRIRN